MPADLCLDGISFHDLYKKANELEIKNRKSSIVFIQRSLLICCNPAPRLLEAIEASYRFPPRA
jgi:hypothetical protein